MLTQRGGSSWWKAQWRKYFCWIDRCLALFSSAIQLLTAIFKWSTSGRWRDKSTANVKLGFWRVSVTIHTCSASDFLILIFISSKSNWGLLAFYSCWESINVMAFMLLFSFWTATSETWKPGMVWTFLKDILGFISISVPSRSHPI